jgi:hypothetical protein
VIDRCARARLILLAAATAAACSSRVGPETFGSAIEPMAPPREYAAWYTELRACLGDTADRPFESIRWYRSQTGAMLTDPRTGEVLAGFWTARRSAIIVGNGYTDDPAVVKHELLHYLRGAGDHRDVAFRAANVCGVAPVPVSAPVSAAAAQTSPPPARSP